MPPHDTKESDTGYEKNMRARSVLGVVALFVLAVLALAWFGFPVEVTNPLPFSLRVQKDEPAAPITLTPRTLKFSDGSTATFSLPLEFDIAVAAEGLGKARFMAMSPDGRMFVPDLVNMNLSREGKIYILSDFDADTKRFGTKETYLSGLRGPNSVAFYTDEEGTDWIYITLTDRLVRYPYQAGDTAPSGEAEVIATFPDWQSPTATGVVWHITRTILFHDDTLYVSVGSGCNVCEQPEDEVRAVILAMDPDGTNVRVYAEGIKNAVGLAMVDGVLYATENGVDHLGVEDPDDLLYRVTEGAHYGWPYCFESGGVKQADASVAWQRTPVSCEDVPRSFTAFEAHTAPLGLAYFSDTHPTLRNSFLVALHGSFDVGIGNGYQLMRVSKEGEQSVFMEGFLDARGARVARAVDVLPVDGTSFFITDDFGGRVFYIFADES